MDGIRTETTEILCNLLHSLELLISGEWFLTASTDLELQLL